MNPHLVLHRRGIDVVVPARFAIRPDQVFGDDKQRHAMHAGRRPLDPGQHQMHDVLGHPVVTPGDEDLIAGDSVVIAFRHRLGSDSGQIRAGLRLGQVHSSRPGTHNKLLKKRGLEIFIGVALKGLDGALAEHGTQRKAEIRRGPKFHGRKANRLGQTHAPELGICRQRGPASVNKLLVERGEALCFRNLTVDDHRRLLLAGVVQGRKNAFGKPRRLVEDGIHQLGGGVGKARQRADGLETRQGSQSKLHIFQRGVIIAHSKNLTCSLLQIHGLRSAAASQRKRHHFLQILGHRIQRGH